MFNVPEATRTPEEDSGLPTTFQYECVMDYCKPDVRVNKETRWLGFFTDKRGKISVP